YIMHLAAIALVVGLVVALLLKETAPAKLRRLERSLTHS
ncbi:MAG: hypothetical protein JWQ03_1561, partial [Variovorax sp.]|nr:hypothetical protein [Variovorax sp.]